jgi:uncharacterized protein (DUF342 family)
MDEQNARPSAAGKKVLEPTLHYTTQFLKIGDDDNSEAIPVTELVRAGHVLANFMNFQRLSLDGYEKGVMEAGENVDFSEDGNELVASIIGYPKTKKFRSARSGELVTRISMEPLFIYDTDNMKVTMAIHPPLADGHWLSEEDIDGLINEQGIVYGLDAEAVDDVRQVIAGRAREFKKITIAKGQPVGQSVDAYLRFDLEIGPIAGTILENGNIDFRDRKIMVGVQAGQQIATKIPAVQGDPGINVFGESTPAKEGRDIKVEVLNDAVYSSETLQVTAKRDGVLSVVNNNVIKVNSHQIIPGDVGYETGHVQSRNAVTIQGSVLPGFKIEVGGDLKIVGAVSTGQITCDSNIVISGGISGKTSSIEAKGDVDLNFIEHGIVVAGGMTVVRKQAYYSRISSGSSVRLGPASIIIGGRIIAAGSISTGDIGGEDAIPALIAAGVLPDRLQLLLDLKASVLEQQEAILDWINKYPGSSQSKKVRRMEAELAETKQQVLRLNLIPGSGLYSRVAPPEGVSPDQEEYCSKNAIAIEDIKIDVFGTVLGGTEIRLGNRSLKLDKTVSSRQFRLHSNGKRILAGPLKKSL